MDEDLAGLRRDSDLSLRGPMDNNRAGSVSRVEDRTKGSAYNLPTDPSDPFLVRIEGNATDRHKNPRASFIFPASRAASAFARQSCDLRPKFWPASSAPKWFDPLSTLVVVMFVSIAFSRFFEQAESGLGRLPWHLSRRTRHAQAAPCDLRMHSTTS